MNQNESTVVYTSKKQRGKKTWALLTALALAVGALAVYTSGFGLSGTQAAAVESSYQILDLTIGDLSASVTGTGTLSLSETSGVEVPAGVKVEAVNTQEGQSVTKGDTLVTLSKASVQEQIESISDELDTLNSTLASLSGDTASSKITSTVEGRIKLSYGKKGDSVADVMKEYGALAVLSVDGYMRVDVPAGEGNASQGQSVEVTRANNTSVSGKVYEISADGSTVTVLVNDKYLDVAESVTVRDSFGSLLGSGEATISSAIRVTGSVGTISSVEADLNEYVYKRSTLYSLNNLPISQEYQAALREREELLADLEQMQAYLVNPVLTAPMDGIVGSIGVTAGETLETEATIDLSTRQRVIVTVSIDELDILNVSPGMTASVTFSAMENETFTGSVAFISAAGTTTNSVTTYPVEIELNDDARFLPGLSATADIVVKESKSALLVPVSALNTSRGETYVYVYDGELPSDDTGEPGTKTTITTGLSNDAYAEVTSGLAVGQQVVADASAAVAADSANAQQGGMMGGDMGGMFGGGSGGPPSGDMPSGGMGGGRPPQ